MKPSLVAITCLSSLPAVAVPPVWNVLSVSCVPGSPIDCAAITPTASPGFTNLLSAIFRP